MKKDESIFMTKDKFAFLCVLLFIVVGVASFLFSSHILQNKTSVELQRLAAEAENREFADYFKMQLNPIADRNNNLYCAFFPSSETKVILDEYNMRFGENIQYEHLLSYSREICENLGVQAPGLVKASFQ